MIKAIETHYRGYRFRSRLEARWAVYFDTLTVPFEYELEGYDLGALGWYLPDFYFPTLNCFGEVKPFALTDQEMAKAIALPKACILLVGSPDMRWYELASGYDPKTTADFDGTLCPGMSAVDLAISFSRHSLWYAYMGHNPDPKYLSDRYEGISIQTAINAARSERFER